MREQMTRRERVMAAARGEPVDRVPLSFFGHHHEAERTAESNVAFLTEQNRRLDWDFMKLQLSNSYLGAAWGAEYRWDPETSPVSGAVLVKPAVKKVEDLAKLRRLDPTKGVFGEHVRMGRLFRDALGDEVPFVHTIFSPLLVAGLLTDATPRTASIVTELRRLMRESPDTLHEALSTIAKTLSDYARECVRVGADGIFMTNSPWSRDVITEEEYVHFAKPYDVAVLEAANEEGATFNMMHPCKEDIMLNVISDYPVAVLSYDSVSHRNPSLRVTLEQTDKSVWGGLHRDTLLNGPLEAIRAEVQDAFKQTGGRRFLLGPSCAISDRVSDSHLSAARDAIIQCGTPKGLKLW
ncbi:uroporphyrinogen decarboxylase family protein [Chloroflexota bacterium]